jgi:hypothetical protein
MIPAGFVAIAAIVTALALAADGLKFPGPLCRRLQRGLSAMACAIVAWAYMHSAVEAFAEAEISKILRWSVLAMMLCIIAEVIGRWIIRLKK